MIPLLPLSISSILILAQILLDDEARPGFGRHTTLPGMLFNG
jgi:hypothetical protein